jgi:hypothetical protein
LIDTDVEKELQNKGKHGDEQLLYKLCGTHQEEKLISKRKVRESMMLLSSTVNKTIGNPLSMYL